ncbi:MAG TPA: MFS transporter [Caulobacteraceae bacterium]|nr:MFS transporter [Caulobacteraceae bacterium]
MASRAAHPWAVFAANSLLFFIVMAGTFSTLGVVLPAMVRELRWNWTEAGLGYTLLGVTCGLTSVLAAALVRRFGVKGTLACGGALLVSGYGALALTHSLWLYLAATSVIGVAFSLSSTVPGTYVLTGIFKRRSTVLGAYFTIGALGGVAGPLIYISVAPAAGWRAFWWLLVALSAVLAAWAVLSSPNRVEHGPEDETELASVAPGELVERLSDWTVRRALATSQFYVIVGAYTMYLLINTTAHGFAVEHLVEHGVAQKAAAEMLSVEALIGAAVSVLGGMAGEKVRAKTLLAVCMITLIAGMTALAYARGWWLMSVYALGVGIGYGLSFVASTMLLLTYFGRRAYLELYSIMCLISTAAALGPAVGGWARDTLGTFAGVFDLCALAALVMLIATLAMKPPVIAGAREAQAAEPLPSRAL